MAIPQAKSGATGNAKHELVPGELLYLSSEEPHSLHGLEEAAVLVTILRR